MGCDIHLFIEYKKPNYDLTRSFGDEIRLSRDYEMFNYMAGVRGDEDTRIFPARGLPEKLSWNVEDANRLFLTDDEDESKADGYALRSVAERWVKSGSSKFEGDSYVTHPDWHSHSWLTVAEFEKCVNLANPDVDYKAALAAMKVFESDGYETRVVFWFDN